MSKKLVIITICAAIILAGLMLYFSTQEVSSPEPESNEQLQSQELPDSDNANPRYLEYSETSFAEASDKNRILYFHADWCPQCRALEASILDSQIPEDMVILKVDYDSNQDLRRQYEVTLQTTLVSVDANGNKIKSFVAYDEPNFTTLEREFIN